jgi:hypothetical protein
MTAPLLAIGSGIRFTEFDFLFGFFEGPACRLR